jgi:YesN/AraC family two-component response regulator
MATVQSHAKFSLLIVEDDKTARDIIVRMVSLHFPDCTMFTAENGKVGVELFKERAPDIVLTDVNMPEMDGIEMAREIRSLNAEATYIVLTAYSDKGSFEKFTEIGYCAYLMKPIDFKELFATIETCLVKRATPRE